MKKQILTGFCLLLVSCSVFAKTVTLAILSYDMVEAKTKLTATQAFQPFTSALEKQTGWKIKLITYADYRDALKLLEKNKINFIYTKIFPYLTAKSADPRIRPVASIVEWNPQHTKLLPTYSGYIISNKNNPNINSIKDLKGKDFGFVSHYSASGFIYPIHYLYKRGINYRHFFGSSQLFGTHSRLLTAIKNGQVQAGAVWAGIFYSHSIKPFKILAVIKDIPTPLFAASPHVSTIDFKTFQKALFKLPKSAYRYIAFKGVVKPEVASYDAILPLAKEIGIASHEKTNDQ